MNKTANRCGCTHTHTHTHTIYILKNEKFSFIAKVYFAYKNIDNNMETRVV